MKTLVERIIARPWFWCVVFPLIGGFAAGVMGKNDLMLIMIGVSIFFGFGFGANHIIERQ